MAVFVVKRFYEINASARVLQVYSYTFRHKDANIA